MAHASEVFVTGKCRLSFPSLFKPTAFRDNEPKYSASLIFDKNDKTHEKIKAATKKVVKASYPDGKIPKDLTIAVRDGDDREYEGYEGKMYIAAKASAENQPTVLDEKVELVLDPATMYPGCYVRAEIAVYLNKAWKKVCIGLNHIQKIGDGERLGGGKSKPEDIFEKVETEDEIDDRFA